ncbi:MAG: hypothetical protein ACOC8P_00425 [Dichotomicrobium sp.]
MTTETLPELERRLAMDRIDGIISCIHPVGDGWLDSTEFVVVSSLEIDDAIRYLDQRGLLERKPDAPHIVRVKEASHD